MPYMTLAAPWLLVHDVYLWIPFLTWKGCNVRVPTWSGQPENSFKAWVCGSTREAMGTRWSLVYRKGQRLGQTNTKAFNTQQHHWTKELHTPWAGSSEVQRGDQTLSGLEKDTSLNPHTPVAWWAAWQLHLACG